MQDFYFSKFTKFRNNHNAKRPELSSTFENILKKRLGRLKTGRLPDLPFGLDTHLSVRFLKLSFCWIFFLQKNGWKNHGIQKWGTAGTSQRSSNVRISFALISSTALCWCHSEQLRQSFAVAMGAGVGWKGFLTFEKGEWKRAKSLQSNWVCGEKTPTEVVWYDDMMTFLWGSWYHCQLKAE